VTEPDLPSLRCASRARADGADPIGTAGTVAGWVLVEWPLPWPADVGDHPELGVLAAVGAASGVRLQLLVPERRTSRLRVSVHRADVADGFSRYDGVQVDVEADEAIAAALELVAGGGGGAPVEGDVALVCGHGRRDPCCGSLGTALAVRAASSPLPAAVRRTSHLGGHRFAPTALVLPHGTVWAFADVDLLERVIGRRGHHEDLLPRYRGCSGVGPAAVQALERVAFAEVGWPWLDWRRHGSVVDPGTGRVRLEASSPAGERSAWEATVVVARDVPIPDCGRPGATGAKVHQELRVLDVTRVHPR
jgi:hypothetical protein